MRFSIKKVMSKLFGRINRKDTQVEEKVWLPKFKRDNHIKCTHKDDKGFTLVFNNDLDGGHYTHTCSQCGKLIHIAMYNTDELNMAIRTIDDACDLIKMMSHPDKDKDLIRKITVIQSGVESLIPFAYKTCHNPSKK